MRRRAALAALLLFFLLPLALEVPAQTPTDPAFGTVYWQRNAAMAHGDPQRSGAVDITLPIAEMGVLWKRAGADPILAGAVSDENRAYTVDREGVVTARWLATGDVAWRQALGEAVTATPALAYGWLYVAGMDGTLFALERHTGTIMESATITKEARAATLVAQARVFQGTDEGILHVLDARTLTPIWTFSSGTTQLNATAATVDVDRTRPIRAPPALSADAGGTVVYVAADNGRVFALRVAGTPHGQPHALVWTRDLAATQQAGNVAGITPAAPVYDVHRKHVIVGTPDGRLLGLKAADGTVAWWAQGGASYVASIAVDEDLIVAVSSDHGTSAYNASHAPHATNPRAAIWTQTEPAGSLTSPILTRNAIVATGANGTVLLLSRANGTNLPHPAHQDGLARWTFDAAVHAAPAVMRAGIVLTDHTGNTTLIGAPPKWEADLRAHEVRLLGAPDANGTVDLDLRVANRGPHDAPDVRAVLEQDGHVVAETLLGALAVGAEQRWIPSIALGTGSHMVSVRFEAVGASDPAPGPARAATTLNILPPDDEGVSAPYDPSGAVARAGFQTAFASGLAGAAIPGTLAGLVAGIAATRWLRARRAAAPA